MDVGPEMPDEAAEGGDPSQAGERLADQIMAKVPPEFQSATDRIVTAGKTIMFSKNTHEKIMAKFDNNPRLQELYLAAKQELKNIHAPT